MIKNLKCYILAVLATVLLTTMLANTAQAENGFSQVFASAERVSATYNSADFTNRDWRGVVLYLNITAETGTATLDVKVQGKDQLSGVYYDIPGAALDQKSATGSDALTLYPGIGETANESVSDVLPRTWRVVAVVAGAVSSFTFSMNVALQQ